MLKYYLPDIWVFLHTESKQCQKIVNEERILEKLLNFKLNCILYVNQVKLEPDNN